MGQWKEGRAGCCSLLYGDVRPSPMDRVLANHAAVGIRATVCRGSIAEDQVAEDQIAEGQIAEGQIAEGQIAEDQIAVAAGRNWDLCERTSRPGEGHESYRCGLRPGDAAAPAVSVSAERGGVVGLGQIGEVLPLNPAGGPVEALMERIESVVAEEQWIIVRLNGADIDGLGENGHRTLLSWLGDHHARIWCAPVIDIYAWARRSA